MNTTPPMGPIHPITPITEAELHALVDGQLTRERQRDVEAALASRPDEASRVEAYRAQKRELRVLFDPVLVEAVPQRLLGAARPRTPWVLQRLAAGIAIALVSGATGWGLHGEMSNRATSTGPVPPGPASFGVASATGFAQRAAVAHAVYAPEQRRPVEVDAAHEDQLVAWLSKRMGSPMKPPHLQAVGYALEGGRLLPGGQGPVAQFMYRDASGGRLTLYVSNEIGELGASAPGNEANATLSASTGVNEQTAFRFAREGKVNVFYWVAGPFGYAISADADRAALARVLEEVYRQLNAPVR